ncbi:MAG: protein-ADP-ribose hydrolase [bacterium]|nr:protein-ADP-ribose hydrolase [bacterium]
MNQKERRNYLLKELIAENREYDHLKIPSNESEQKQLLRGLMNIRTPKAISKEFLTVQDRYLQEEIEANGIVEVEQLLPMKDGIYLWQGDITRLKCDAIVNAANSGMTGCYVPNHRCIDNCIHSFSGLQLRLKCSEIMEQQGHAEETGKAKLTPAYNLPCNYILHTVGPIIYGELTKSDCDLLENCYRSCLELAAKHQLESVAFCCISTGEFHFPNEKAAKIAVAAVMDFMKKETSIKKVVFNVFKDLDKEIYRELLK